jgi:hypothetical protein
MSLLALAASAALSAAAAPVHSVNLEHRGTAYRVDYRPHLETRLRTIGMSAGPRPSTQKCVVTAEVSVERVIASQAGQELRALLPTREAFTQHLPGSCHGRDASAASKSASVGAHVARVAESDHAGVIAAIDSAYHFAAN